MVNNVVMTLNTTAKGNPKESLDYECEQYKDSTLGRCRKVVCRIAVNNKILGLKLYLH